MSYVEGISESFAHLFVILTTGALATGGTDLGQLRVSEAGSGFEIAKQSFTATSAAAESPASSPSP
jgi:hypothetical protein